MGRTDFLLELIRTSWYCSVFSPWRSATSSAATTLKAADFAAESGWRGFHRAKGDNRDSAPAAGTCLPSWHRAVESCAKCVR
jgi:hypothetical protein